VGELGWRRGPASVTFNTDTIDLRWSQEGDGGRWWVALRGEARLAGLMRTPWTDGEPDPSRALRASHAGVEAGQAWYLPGGGWLSASAATRSYVLSSVEETEIPVPPTTHMVTPALAGGWWSPGVNAYLRLSSDLRSEGDEAVSPAAYGELKAHPHWSIAPRFEVRAGVAEGQDELTRTRLGGVVPYCVPVAGTSWAEWWVEDFVAARAGLSLRWDEGHVSVLGDSATFDDQGVEGFGVDFVQDWSPWKLELAAGYAPWVKRQPDVHRFTTWARVSREWTPW
jgi:hypothetical protein